MSNRRLRILILTGDHELPDPTKRNARYNEEDRATHDAMVRAFRSMQAFDFEVCTSHAGLLERLERRRPDLVVNFCDTGFRNVPSMELNVPALLELLDIPYTGAPPAAMVICYDKAIVRLVARELGIPVPGERFISAAAPLAALPGPFPALVKPNTGDGSVGITADAVVRDEAEARAYVERLRAELPGRDILMQEYLPGPEYGIGLIGNPDAGLRALPALGVDFSRLPPGLDPILSYESKAMPDSPYWTDIGFQRAALAADAEATLGEWSRTLFRRLSLRDYARFDFRVAADGEPRLMEVNPNPAWANDGKLAFMAGFDRIEYRDMLRLILDAALIRTGLASADQQ